MDTKTTDIELQEPRFEFRVFGQNIDNAAKRMARLSMPVPEKLWERQSKEIYILSNLNDQSSIKIRDGKIDIKNLVKIEQGFEQWEPILKIAFPLPTKLLNDGVFSALNVETPHLSKDSYSYEDFLNIISRLSALKVAYVDKKRYAYLVNNTICEVATVLVNGAAISTISSESTNIEDIKKTVKDIGLEGVENVNYLQALKRIVGIVNKPFVN